MFVMNTELVHDSAVFNLKKKPSKLEHKIDLSECIFFPICKLVEVLVKKIYKSCLFSSLSPVIFKKFNAEIIFLKLF